MLPLDYANVGMVAIDQNQVEFPSGQSLGIRKHTG
jgi:hypothetical protein